MSLLTYLANIHLDLLRATEKCYTWKRSHKPVRTAITLLKMVPLENTHLKAPGSPTSHSNSQPFLRFPKANDKDKRKLSSSGSCTSQVPILRAQYICSPVFFSSKLHSNLKASRWRPASPKTLSWEHLFQEMSTGLNTPTQRDPSTEKNGLLKIINQDSL